MISPAPKSSPVDDKLKRFYQAVKFSPCLACGKPGPSEAAHISVIASLKNAGATIPRGHKGIAAYGAIPLCYECHRGPRGIHSTTEAEWIEHHISGGMLRAATWVATTLALLYDEC